MPTKEGLQATVANVRAAWKHFRSWERQFRASAKSKKQYGDNLIYLANWGLVPSSDLIDINNIYDDAVDHKIAFMKAYLSVTGTEIKDFCGYVKTILKLQSSHSARDALGFWFWQSDMDKFGAGVSTIFQGDQISIFCNSLDQIWFADVSAVLPYDNIMIRSPKSWTPTRIRKMRDHIKWDLAYNGIETKIRTKLYYDLLYITLLSPDYGNELNSNRGRAFYASKRNSPTGET